MNFIQKGDCYDISKAYHTISFRYIFTFSVDNKEGAAEKPWTDENQSLDQCDSCEEHEYCNLTFTINVDLQNVSLIFTICHNNIEKELNF